MSKVAPACLSHANRCVAVLAICALAAPAWTQSTAGRPPPPLKVYISADMEGVAGLVANAQFAETGG